MDVIRFESFEVDRGAYELRRAGRPVAIERIPMELLLLLLERRGQLVTRQEILDRLRSGELTAEEAIRALEALK